MIYWLGFFICAGAIVYSGTKLSRYADIIAEKLHLGRAWVGMVLLATATSLPELVNGVGSVTYAGVPDIAAGDVFGSCVFNVLLLVVLDAMSRDVPLSSSAQQGNLLSAGFGIVLISLAGLHLFVREAAPSVGWIGFYSLVLVGIYLVAVRMVYMYERRKFNELVKGLAVELRYEQISARSAYTRYAAHAGVVVVAAVFLPLIGKGLAESMHLGQSFVGNIFIAVATSLPELVVSVAALRMGGIDLAVGNLFGSNLFNISVLAVDDFFYLKGPLLEHVSPAHIIPAFSCVAMTAVAMLGLFYRQERKRIFLAWDSVGIAVIFVLNLMFLYALG